MEEESHLRQVEADHDLLIEIKVEVKNILAVLKSIEDNTSKRLDDHELRIRIIERYVWIAIGALGILQIVLKFVI